MGDSRHINDKVVQLFKELTPDRADRLDFFETHPEAADKIASAFHTTCSRSGELAFHLSDFRADAAFIVALHLFPERFTLEEVVAGFDEFFAHVPYHLERAIQIADEPPDS